MSHMDVGFVFAHADGLPTAGGDKAHYEHVQPAMLSVRTTGEPPQVAQAQERADARAASSAPPPDLPLYQVYQVQAGDSVGTIAKRFGVESDYILANNAEIQRDSDLLKLGQSIIVPAGNGILHEVRYGETLR